MFGKRNAFTRKSQKGVQDPRGESDTIMGKGRKQTPSRREKEKQKRRRRTRGRKNFLPAEQGKRKEGRVIWT